MRLLAIFALVALVVAEPPVGNQYLPPSSRGSNSYSRQAPSSQYGAPSITSARFAGPSQEYGAPGFGGGFGGGRGGTAAPSGPPAAKVSIRFGYSGASSRGRNGGGFGGQSSRYAASSPSSTYGAPSGLSASYSSPSDSYGPPAPIPVARFGGASNRAPSARYGAPAPSSRYGAPGGGSNGYARGRGGSFDEDAVSEPAQYEFTYDINDQYSGLEFGHQESREYEAAQGEYRVLLPDGRTQIVTYEADDSGYRPDIRYEDPEGGYGRSGNGLGGPY